MSVQVYFRHEMIDSSLPTISGEFDHCLVCGAKVIYYVEKLGVTNLHDIKDYTVFVATCRQHLSQVIDAPVPASIDLPAIIK